MNWAQVISTLIFVLGTFVSIVSALYLASIYKQRLPEHLAVRLEQFARLAVHKVEQQERKMSPAAKKQLAILAVSTLLQAFRLPAIDPKAINIAVEAAVLLLPKPVIVESDNPPRITELSQAVVSVDPTKPNG